MHQRVSFTPAGCRRRKLSCVRGLLFCLAQVLCLSFATAAQTSKTVTLKPDQPAVAFKIKPTRDLTSGRIRIGDYVQFDLIEDLKLSPDGGGDREIIIAKGTPIFGQVIDRHERFTILKKGGFGIGRLWTTTVDGSRVDLDVKRPELALKKKSKDEMDGLCVDKTLEEDQRYALAPCIRGRVYAGTFISNLPGALLAVATATTLTRVKDKATHAVVGLTLADKVVSQPGLSNIINGADAEMAGGEIFDAEVILKGVLVIKIPGGDAQGNKGVEKVGRYTNVPVPPGYVVTDYFSDVVKYPSLPGQKTVYTGQVIERYTDKSPGSKMNICEGQRPPSGWIVIDRIFDPKICPREPGDQSQGPTYGVIMKTP
jgi:hypothetical protein